MDVTYVFMLPAVTDAADVTGRNGSIITAGTPQAAKRVTTENKATIQFLAPWPLLCTLYLAFLADLRLIQHR